MLAMMTVCEDLLVSMSHSADLNEIDVLVLDWRMRYSYLVHLLILSLKSMATSSQCRLTPSRLRVG